MIREIRGTECVLRNFVECHGTRRLRLCVLVKEIVYALNVERIDLGNLLATDPQLEFSRCGFILVEKSRVRVTYTPNIVTFDPHVTQKITLRLDWDGHFITTRECTDVVEPFWLNCKVGVALVVLTKKAHFGLTSDVYILGSDRYEVN